MQGSDVIVISHKFYCAVLVEDGEMSNDVTHITDSQKKINSTLNTIAPTSVSVTSSNTPLVA